MKWPPGVESAGGFAAALTTFLLVLEQKLQLQWAQIEGLA